MPARALEKNVESPAHGSVVEGLPLRVDERLQPGEAFGLVGLRNLIGALRGGRARTGAVFEEEAAREPDRLDELQRLPEILLGLSREPDDEIGGQSDVRARG